MYDGLTSRYTFPCPRRGEARVPLSTFSALERLPGAAHPAVYRVAFACECDGEHDALVPHDDLDWAPLAGCAGRFFDVITARLEPAVSELLDYAAQRIRAGAWPWSFFCYLEDRPRPLFPSAFAPGGQALAVAVACPGCGSTSVNLVSRAHVDVRLQRPPRPRPRARLRRRSRGDGGGVPGGARLGVLRRAPSRPRRVAGAPSRSLASGMKRVRGLRR